MTAFPAWNERQLLDRREFAYYPRLRRVRDHVSEHAHRHITLAEAAEIACLERKYFSRFFRKTVGLPYSEWHRRVRIADAMKLLRTEDVSVQQAAYRVGFNCVRTFERAFQRVTHESPMCYKRRVRPERGGVSLHGDIRRQLSRS